LISLAIQYVRLVLDVLSGKTSRDYSCGIKVDEAFETAVHELRAYFGSPSIAGLCNREGVDNASTTFCAERHWLSATDCSIGTPAVCGDAQEHLQ
jgi:hypothetical protein